MVKKAWILATITALVIAVGTGFFLLVPKQQIEIVKVEQAGVGLTAPRSCSDIFTVNATVCNVTSLHCGVATMRIEGPVGIVDVESGRIGGSEIYVTGWYLKPSNEIVVLFEVPRTYTVSGSGNLFSLVLTPQGPGNAKIVLSSVNFVTLAKTSSGRYMPSAMVSEPDVNVTVTLTGTSRATGVEPGSLRIKAIDSETPESIDPPIYQLVYGDANGDLSIDLKDLHALRKFILKGGGVNISERADAWFDYQIDVRDISQLKLILWRKESKLTLVDMAGRVVTVNLPVKRIVTCATRDPVWALFVLRAQDLIVGIDDYDYRYAKQCPYWDVLNYVIPENWSLSLTPVGTPWDPNVEVIGALRPDVVLYYAGKPEIADNIQRYLGVPVVCTYYYAAKLGETPYSFMDNFTLWRLIATLTDRDRLAEELIDYAKTKILWLKERVSRIPISKRVKVYFSYAGPRGSFTTTYARLSIMMAGGRDFVFEVLKPKVFRFFEVSKEEVINWNPDIILVQTRSLQREGRLSFAYGLEGIMEDPALKAIKAVRDGAIYPSPGGMWGLDPAQTICESYYLAKLFYPEEFKDVNMEQECNEILKTFYGVDGIWSKLMDLYREYLPEWMR